jgi:hypothetical protein
MTGRADVVDRPSASPGYVAPLLPATAPPPEATQRINFFKAFFLFWLFPKRLGPYLAAGSFTRALMAHGCAVVLAAGIIAFEPIRDELAAASTQANAELPPTSIRASVAEAVLALAVETTNPSWSWLPILATLAVLPAVELVLLLVATVATPWCAGGDRASSVWKRSVKNVYWSTTFFVPVALGGVLLHTIDFRPWDRFDLLLLLSGLVTFGTCMVLVARMLIVGAHRYVGEPDGPAFAPREPTCDDCGYAIVYLPLVSRCPECGLSIGASLPGGRRQPTAWQAHEMRAKGFLELLRLQWTVLRDPSFFRRLPVQSGIASARHFWWGTFMAMFLATLLVLGLATLVFGLVGPEWPEVEIGIVGAFTAPLPLVLHALMMFPVCLWAQLRCGIRDYRVSASVCYYGTPLMWPTVFVVLAWVFFGTAAAEAHWGPFADVTTNWSDAQRWLWRAVGLACVGTVLGSVLFWLRRLLGAMQAVRYANV